MARLTKDEFMKLARSSNIKMDEDEISKVMESIESVLAYASGLSEVVKKYGSVKQEIPIQNRMRSDQIVPTDSEPLLVLAPDRQDRYFVVPVIVSHSNKNI